jgi:hypothetical protein
MDPRIQPTNIIEDDEDFNFDVEMWDIISQPCMNCGSQRWKGANLSEEGAVTNCDKCPIVKVSH